MTTLLTIENTFLDYLLDDNQAIFQHIISTNKVPAEVRLGIYGHAYRSRLQEALQTSYSILHQYLGDEQFETLCNTYIESHPSQFRSIRWFGDQLPAFLNHHEPYQEYPYLAELAQFEWTMALVFDAADSPIMQLDDMQKIPPNAWSDMQLNVHPSLHRLALSWNVVQIWQAITDDQALDEPQQCASTVPWILWRNELTTQFSSLPVEEAWAIDAVANGSTFGELCEGLCQWMDEENVGMHAASLLKGWITAGLITEAIINL
jgi:hypothetical protein